MVRPILKESTNNNWPKILQYHIYFPGQEKLGYYDCQIRTPTHPFDIILIDAEAEIIKGDLIYKHLGTAIEGEWVIKIATKSDARSFSKGLNFTRKIISSTNKSHNLPQLSPQSIQLLINYYNEHKCMPESIEVEEETVRTQCSYEDAEVIGFDRTPTRLINRLKLNQQGEVDITIPGTRKYLLTSEDGVKMYEGDLFWYTMNMDMVKACKNPRKNFKYYSSKEIAESKLIKKIEEKLYTESEVESLLRDINYEAASGALMEDEFIKWFNFKKK